MTTITIAPMTAAEFAALDIDVPVELVRGEIVEMPRPTVAHGIVCKNAVVILDRWAEAHQPAVVACNDAGVITERDPDTVRGPDAFLFQQPPSGSLIDENGYLRGGPLLVVEVLSPSDRWQDVIAKMDEYFSAGTQEVWIVDPDLRQVQQHRTVPPPVIYHGMETMTSALLPGFSAPADAFFRGLSAPAQ